MLCYVMLCYVMAHQCKMGSAFGSALGSALASSPRRAPQVSSMLIELLARGVELSPTCLGRFVNCVRSRLGLESWQLHSRFSPRH